ncbi:class I SAM-dependent methyltransferase [Pedobacter sp. BS3]|jgi:cyclopropane fatty-acyl-phospholipid synthase-like methyltransferase|uniref:class I SAM-dependent methyltransferase n=1 Tax=Pedobacter sp. BS3 TaxID=2567937 RepID=UPI0011EEE2E1|nr:class I SAM-dependent methyltransferase [Pedobacter sp. BS3]TZF84654.1 class I SAM-dependent methyltransferase [Pedobacter sp. BS3]
MKENKYDEVSFFEQYGKMSRSLKGLDGAGEWHVLKEMLPNLDGKKMLDLGCGYGWHCRYAIENGALSVIGIDISEKMLQKAKEINQLDGIIYRRIALEDVQFTAEMFDVIISSLTFHYIQSYDVLIGKIYQWLKLGGKFIFSVEHPVFTAAGSQDWVYDRAGNKLHWAVDRYFYESQRNTLFLGEEVLKYHRTVSTYLNELLKQGFKITEVKEPMPSEAMLENIPEMKDELRRPMMLLISVEK